MDKEKLQLQIDKHTKWLNDEDGGERADLSGANLSGANLRSADLRSATLSGADLRSADLSGADLSYSAWPLWCGSKRVKVDKRIAAQLAAHFCVLDCDDNDYIEARNAIMDFAKTSHRANDLGIF